MDQQYVPSL